MIDLSLTPPVYNKQAPCKTKLKEKVLLTGPNLSKQTYHVSLDIENTGLKFRPGDSLAVFAQNDPLYVTNLLSVLGCKSDEPLTDPRSGEEMTAFSYFSSKVNLSKISSSLIGYLACLEATGQKREFFSFLIKPENKEQLVTFTAKTDLIDLFLAVPKITAPIQSFCEYFAPLLPRFYSISSSLKAHANEVHLLVALASYQYKEEMRYGVASHFLCNIAAEGITQIPVYVQPSKHFAVPENPDTDVIMIGPGTGVAPYRAFLQERLAENASGENWLFFGGRHRVGDFLYQDLWLELEKAGKLRLSTAFSRDGAEKEYVQHKLLAHGKEVFTKLETGAYFYVCGDAKNMAKDVEAALLNIIQKEGGFSEEETKSYFKSLRASKRYLTDVY